MKNIFKKKKADKDCFMFNEIMAQESVFKSLASIYYNENKEINTENLPQGDWKRVVICASGSSKHVGEIVKYLVEEVLEIPCCVEYSSEFAHKKTPIYNSDLLIAISQSGNTADTYEALLRAKSQGATTVAVTNDKTSKIHEAADFKLLADAGEEKSIAATKSCTAQLFILYTMVFALAQRMGKDVNGYINDFLALSTKYDEVIEQRPEFKKIAQHLKNKKSLAVLGRYINAALAQEGSLKVKETCYINAMFSPAGEFMHGHFAVVDKNIPIIAMLNSAEGSEENYNLCLNNLAEIKKKRKIKLILLKTVGDTKALDVLKPDFCINIPKTGILFAPFLNLVALQFIAFETASLINDDVDKPRDLIKCVAQE